jgi:hypothetical protein
MSGDDRDAWTVVLVENEPRRVFELFDALMVLRTGAMRAHVAGAPELALGARLAPFALLVARPEELGEVDDLREDHPMLADRIVAAGDAYRDPDALFRALDRIVDAAGGRRVLVLWDDQLGTPWALAENANGMTLQFAARWGASLAERGARQRVRLVGISAQRDWTSRQMQDYARFLREGTVDDFRDRGHVDRLVAEQTAPAAATRVAYLARLGGETARGAADQARLERMREEMAELARERLRAVAARLASTPDADVAGTWNPAFAGPLVIDETSGVIEIFEHADRPRWAAEAAWDAPDPATGKRRLATHVLKEITERYLRALRAGGAGEVAAWGWRRLEGGGLDFGSVAYRLLRYLVERGEGVERHEIVRAGLARDSAVNTYASRIRSGLARHEILESVTSGGYRCARDVLLLAR